MVTMMWLSHIAFLIFVSFNRLGWNIYRVYKNSISSEQLATVYITLSHFIS